MSSNLQSNVKRNVIHKRQQIIGEKGNCNLGQFTNVKNNIKRILLTFDRNEKLIASLEMHHNDKAFDRRFWSYHVAW